MRYAEARSYWDFNVNQSPAEFLSACTITELSRGFDAIAADYVRAYDADFRAAGIGEDDIAKLRTAIAWVLERESLLGDLADEDDDAKEFYNPYDDGDRFFRY